MNYKNTFLLAIFASSSVLLSGCAGFMSTSASMQIDVEVYKGPLSKEPEAQWGELVGIIKHAKATFESADVSVKSLDQYKPRGLENLVNGLTDCPDNLTKNLSNVKIKEKVYNFQTGTQKTPTPVTSEEDERSLTKSETINLMKVCSTHRRVKKGIAESLSFINTFAPSNTTSSICNSTNVDATARKQCIDKLMEVSQFASGLQSEAFMIAQTHVGFANKDRFIRGIQVAYANFASQLGNQLSSRADALLKQLKGGVDRETMPLSVYLRDSGETEFIDLFTWNHAGAPAICPPEGCDRTAAQTRDMTRNRVKTVERLFQDHNWENINSVHASGQGNVRMAFVKDEIGNWNLKSYTNDPSELLDAYFGLTQAAITAAKDALSSNVSAAKKSLEFANNLAFGTPTDDSSSYQKRMISSLHARALSDLDALKVSITNEEEALKKKLAEFNENILLKEEALNEAKTQLETDKPNSEEDAATLRTNAAKRLGSAEASERNVDRLERNRDALEDKLIELAGSDDANRQDRVTEINQKLTQVKGEIRIEKGHATRYKNEAEEMTTLAESLEAHDAKVSETLKPLEEELAKLKKDQEDTQISQNGLPAKAAAKTAAIISNYDTMISELEALSVTEEENNKTQSSTSSAVSALLSDDV